MSEGATPPVGPQNPNRSEEELREGVILDPGERLVTDVSRKFGESEYAYELGNGQAVTGRVVADIRLGAGGEYANGEVIRTSDLSVDSGGLFARFHPALNGGEALFVELKDGQPWGVGRDFEGQADVLPSTVAGKHVVLSREGSSLVVENTLPPDTNTFTEVRKT